MFIACNFALIYFIYLDEHQFHLLHTLDIPLYYMLYPVIFDFLSLSFYFSIVLKQKYFVCQYKSRSEDMARKRGKKISVILRKNTTN